MKILIVDDEPDVSMALSHLLERKGYSTRTAATALHAIEILRTNDDVGLVIVDWHLQCPLGGLAVARHVKRCVPVFLISGYPMSQINPPPPNPLEGVTMFFAKPIETEQLLLAIERAERAAEDTPPHGHPL